MKAKVLIAILTINAMVPVSFAQTTKCNHKDNNSLFAKTNPKSSGSTAVAKGSSGISKTGSR
jgi:hypothetical protein